MFSLPREKKPGQKILAADWNLLLRFVKSITPRGGPHLRINLGADGYTSTPLLPPAGRRVISQAAGGYSPWDIYKSTFAGPGSPPADQGRRVRVWRGHVNNRVPSNLGNEFVMPPNATTPLYLQASIAWSASGVGSFTITSLTLQQGETPETPSGHHPAVTYWEIGAVTTNANAILYIQQEERSSLNMRAVQEAYDCEDAIQGIAWK